MYSENISKDYIVHPKNTKNIIIHDYKNKEIGFNKYAKNSLLYKNEGGKRAKDEAMSIHIITNVLNTRLNILYEKQINGFFGKPDFIIRLGKNMFIMVSTTRAFLKNKIRSKHEWDDLFNIEIANSLIKKKLEMLDVCSYNLEYLVDDICENPRIQPVLHILSPNIKNAELCKTAYESESKKYSIKLIITIINDTKYYV